MDANKLEIVQQRCWRTFVDSLHLLPGSMHRELVAHVLQDLIDSKKIIHFHEMFCKSCEEATKLLDGRNDG